MSFVFKPAWQNEGKGARVVRVIGNEYVKNMDPFLMLDFFKVKLPAGFPDHPHRGFETVTYMLKGTFYHEDFKGHQGAIGPGDLQWMTAGKGILHAEMPASFEQESLGFQLWINLQSKNKMIEPTYQEFKNLQIPIIKKEKATVKVISGQWEGTKGPILARTPTYYYDIQLPAQGQFQLTIPAKWSSLIFCYESTLSYKNKEVGEYHACVLQQSNVSSIEHSFTSGSGCKFILISGQPINQPIAQHGPFVMNTKQELKSTFQDYSNARNGFENAHKWSSKIQNLVNGAKIDDL